MKLKIRKIQIFEKSKISAALKQLQSTGLRCLIVIDKNKKYLGTITDGDLRKDLLKNKDFSKNISKIYNSNSFYFKNKNFSEKIAVKLIKEKGIPMIPILDKNGFPLDYYNLLNSKKDKLLEKKKLIKDNKILIMAGGLGSRLKPFTSILPKPLIPYKDKPVLIHIMDGFKKNGFNNFLISINAKNRILKFYLSEFNKIYDFDYIQENNPLGTAGILKKIKKPHKDFFIINCDSLININANNLLNFHKDNKNILTLVVSIKKIDIPYGVCTLSKNNKSLLQIEEKPEKNFFANTGLYICSPQILNFLPKKKKFDMNYLINNLKRKNKKIGIFPVKDSDWKDTGNWIDYLNINQSDKNG